MAQEARSFIPRLFCDNSHLSAEELEELASKLSPGSSHTGGWLASLVYNSLRWEVDPILIAATIRWNWHGGRGRFEFLPDPAESDTQDYQGLASDLIEFLQDATDRNPRRILTGEDREFYESLPEMFTVYRGCAGISSEMAAAGVCWTIKRDVAEWFAYRSGSKGRLVMTARVNKKDIAFVKATEFEIAMQPRHARQIKCREHPDTWHPKMGGLS